MKRQLIIVFDFPPLRRMFSLWKLKSFSIVKPLRLAFFRFQNWPMVLVASSSHSGSASKAINWMALKNFTALGLGRPGAAACPR